MNPCPCGFHGDRRRECRCTAGEVVRYRSQISGPLLDRVDLHVEVPGLTYADLSGAPTGEATSAVQGRVGEARRVQRERLAGTSVFCNAQMSARQTRELCRLDPTGARTDRRGDARAPS
jgi:magnesium chelatase family protein